MNQYGFAKITAAFGLIAGFGVAVAQETPRPKTPPVIGFVDAGKDACWARSYDPAHLASHPLQKVTGIAVAYVASVDIEGQEEPQPIWDIFESGPTLFAKLVVTVKGDPRPAFGSLNCTAGTAKVLKCGIEGDGGQVTLTLQDDGRVRLDNPEGFSTEYNSDDPNEPNGGFVTVDPKDDHKAFLMSPATGGLCDADWTAP